MIFSLGFGNQNKLFDAVTMLCMLIESHASLKWSNLPLIGCRLSFQMYLKIKVFPSFGGGCCFQLCIFEQVLCYKYIMTPVQNWKRYRRT